MASADLPKEKRLIAAQVAGAVTRLAWGKDADQPIEDKLGELWELTRDPEVFGHVLGPYLAEEPQSRGAFGAAVLLTVAGADRATAEANAAWQRERRQREQGGPRT
jgi:ribosomal protein S18 acetylase RimI-like enzyme